MNNNQQYTSITLNPDCPTTLTDQKQQPVPPQQPKPPNTLNCSRTHITSTPGKIAGSVLVLGVIAVLFALVSRVRELERDGDRVMKLYREVRGDVEGVRRRERDLGFYMWVLARGGNFYGNLSLYDTVQDDYLFDVPKNIYVYVDSSQMTQLSTLYIQNYLYYGAKSNYNVTVLNQHNYYQHLSNKEQQRVDKMLKIVSQLHKNDKSKDKDKMQKSIFQLKRKIILLSILNQNGGVIITKNYAFVEDLEWIKNIVRNPYTNKANSNVKPQLIAFYRPKQSISSNPQDPATSTRHKLKAPNHKDPNLNKNTNATNHEQQQQLQKQQSFYKYFVQIPVIDDGFFVAQPKTMFLRDLLDRLEDVLRDFDRYEELKRSYGLAAREQQLQTKVNIYDQLIPITIQILLIDKQTQLTTLSNTLNSAPTPPTTPSIDHYSLSLLPTSLGPHKLHLPYFHDKLYTSRHDPAITTHKVYYQLARMGREELEAYVGPFRYVFELGEGMEGYLVGSRDGRDVQVSGGSLIADVFFRGKSWDGVVVENAERSFIDYDNPEWKQLPKIIWVYWDKGVAQAPLFHRICFQNLKQKAVQSNFKLIQLNNSNLAQYIQPATLNRIPKPPNSQSFQVQKLSDLLRLAVLHQYGGVYLDLTTIPIDTFDWITRISRLSSQYVYNRFGGNPKVLMVFHPVYGRAEGWGYEDVDWDWKGNKSKGNTKTQWVLGLENSFIAAEKNSQLIGEWFQLLVEVSQWPYEQFSQLMTKYGINQEYRWTNTEDTYLLAMDTLKTVLARRQHTLTTSLTPTPINSAHYYHLWSVNSYLFYTKLRQNLNPTPLNLPNRPAVNSLLFHYPLDYAESVVGPIGRMVKFFGYESWGIEFYVREIARGGDLDGSLDSGSFVMRYVFTGAVWDFVRREGIDGNSTRGEQSGQGN